MTVQSGVDRFTLQSVLNRLTWQCYVGGADPIQLKNELAQTRDAMRHLLREITIDQDAPPELQADLTLAKIEVEPQISHLRNIFEYSDGSIAPETAAHYLIELCSRRNEHARAQGYSSYPQLALCAQGLADTGDANYRSVLRYLEVPAARDSIELPYVPFMEQYWTVMEEQFDPHETYTEDHYRQFLRSLLEAIKLADAAEHLEIVVKEQPYAAGVALDLSQGDCRRAGILIRPSGVRAFFTSAHELGHALLYLHRSNVNSVLPAWLDEGYAHLIEDDERLISVALRDLCLKDETIHTWLSTHRRFCQIEHNRIWASILTEDALWACVDRSNLTDEEKIDVITDQCADFYRRYLNTTYEDPQKWALDSFRSIDPVYIHSYPLAQSFAALMLKESSVISPRYDTSPAGIAAINDYIVSTRRTGQL